jgi:hypothetical protein
VFVIVCLSLLGLTAYQLFDALPYLFEHHIVAGCDYRVFAGAVQSLDHGLDPYLLENINRYTGGSNLLFVYPPHTLYLFSVLDLLLVFRHIEIYYALLVVLLAVSGYLILTLDRQRDPLFLATLMLTAFMSCYWNFYTGNKDILFLFLFALLFGLLLKERYRQSALVMGFAAAVSLTTAPFVALYLVARRSLADRLTYIALSGGVVAALFVVSYCIGPAYLVSYYGVLRGSSSPFAEPGGLNVPTPYLFFNDLLTTLHAGGTVPLVLVCCVYAGLVLYATGQYVLKNRRDDIKVYSVTMLAIFMMMPRIKPYDFILLVIPLYLLFRSGSYRLKALVLAICSVPIFIWYFPLVGSIYDLPFTGAYGQTYSLLLIFAGVILHNHFVTAGQLAGNEPGS